MTRKPQVCNKENAKKLAELGVTVESYFEYDRFGAVYDRGAYGFHYRKYDPYTPTFTVGELGLILPCEVGRYTLCLAKSPGGWVVTYENSSFLRLGRAGVFSTSEADARALMLIWLIENGHVSVEQINGEAT